MTDKTRKTTGSAGTAPGTAPGIPGGTPLGVPDLVNGPLGDAMTRYGETCAQGLAALQQEVAGFAETRIASNQALAQKMAQCREWTELVQLQQDWARETSAAYLAESSRMTSLFSELSRAWLGPMEAMLEAAPAAMRQAMPRRKGD